MAAREYSRSFRTPRRPILSGLSVILLLLVLLPVCCSGEESRKSTPILLVNGIAVTLEDLNDQIAFERTFRPDAPASQERHPSARSREELIEEIITRQLIPLAAVQSAYKDKIPGLLEKAKEARSRVNEDRSNFDDISAELSARSVAASRGRLGYVSRNCGLPYPLPQKAFSLKAGELSEPFLSLVGCHVLYVQKVEEGAVDATDRVLVFHILLPFDDRDDFMHEIVPKLAAEAGIEVKNPEYARFAKSAGGKEEGQGK